MFRRFKSRLGMLLGLGTVALLLAGGAVVATSATATAQTATGLRPIIFVHGLLGSGSQFQTQAKRFASNGYPATYIESQEYNSLGLNTTELYAELDQRIARLKTSTGADKVELAGHSMGTFVLQGYLNSSAARAANVAHYANLDGLGAATLPGGVPTLGVFGEGNNATITGGTNVRLPDQAHVQVTSSAETFDAMFRFFTGRAPATTDVVAQPGQIQLGGRAIQFPANGGVTNARLDVYAVNPATGVRTATQPVATFQLSGDGSFGPFNGSGTASYEFAVTHSGGQVHHQYFQPFRRTDLGIRLLTTTPGTGIDLFLERDARNVVALVYRNKEFWGDQGNNSDTLTINGTSVLNATTAPRSRRAIGLFGYDVGRDQRSNVTTSPGVFGVLPFMTATDIYVPAAAAANGRVTFESRQRGAGLFQTDRIVTPNWPSDRNLVTVTFNDYVNR